MLGVCGHIVAGQTSTLVIDGLAWHNSMQASMHHGTRMMPRVFCFDTHAGLGMRALLVVSISFDPHVLDITATITSGGCLVLPRPGGHMEPAYIAELIKQERVTHVLTSVPSMSAHYMTAVGSYAGMRVWLMGGEPLSPELAIRMQKVRDVRDVCRIAEVFILLSFGTAALSLQCQCFWVIILWSLLLCCSRHGCPATCFCNAAF